MTILGHMDWSVSRGSTSVIMGPGGAGKTSLMRALAGFNDSPLELEGEWMYCGRSIASGGRRPTPAEGIAWCGQPPRGWSRDHGRGPALERALRDTDADVVLLDEPDMWVQDDDHEELLSRIGALAATSTVVLSTHNISFGRRCADDICLLSGGRIIESSSAARFFASESVLTQHFLRTGSLELGKITIPPPSGFHWVLDRHLGGMAQPGMLRPLVDDIEFFEASGVDVLVTLTESPLATSAIAQLNAHGVGRVLHWPIPDMDVPSRQAALHMIRRLSEMYLAGKIVVVHCHGGLGRTGLVLAMMLVAQGHSPEDAVNYLRSIQPLYIQTEGQLQFVHAMASELVSTQ
ncbi:MAG: ATP-binding cassette domain-containing protein [Deltaproteobacteria bacterium]|nr:ATP-binding cassette domain-containing protein [Deltaproteobacteria bacterium]